MENTVKITNTLIVEGKNNGTLYLINSLNGRLLAEWNKEKEIWYSDDGFYKLDIDIEAIKENGEDENFKVVS